MLFLKSSRFFKEHKKYVVILGQADCSVPPKNRHPRQTVCPKTPEGSHSCESRNPLLLPCFASVFPKAQSPKPKARFLLAHLNTFYVMSGVLTRHHSVAYPVGKSYLPPNFTFFQSSNKQHNKNSLKWHKHCPIIYGLMFFVLPLPIFNSKSLCL